jgi:CDP-diacylglycerol--glycerol-3-phosphate 3-phosphatidyltransferase
MLVPLLWALAILDLGVEFAIGLSVAAATDVFDGIISRALHATTRFGSKLDSIADVSIGVSAVGWLLLFRPSVMGDHPIFFAAIGITTVVNLTLIYRKFGRLADLHMNSGRAAGIVGYVLLILLTGFGEFVEPLFWLLMVLAWIVAADSLVLVATRDRLDEHVSYPTVSYLAARVRGERRRSGASQ